MGWCYEFGAQICEGCSSPMVASSSSCTCDQCGTVCTGRFSSCRDVWARGPQPFTVVSPPALPGGATVPAVSTNGQSATPAHGTPRVTAVPGALRPAPAAAATAAGADVPVLGQRLAEVEARLGALEAVVSYVQSLRRALRKELQRVGADAKERDRQLNELTERVGALETRLTGLQTVPARVDALSREVFEARRAIPEGTGARLDELDSRLREAAALATRVAALEARGPSPASESLQRCIQAAEERPPGL